jgi:hypothetical protein
VSDQGNTKRVDITIGDHELGFARVRGETVSGYIGRLIRADNAGGSMRVPMPDPIAKALDQSGVLCGPRGDQLRSRIKAVLIDLAQD